MKITGSTTLGELAIARAKLGISGMAMSIMPENHRDPVLVRVRCPGLSDFGIIGKGMTEADALDDAFARITHLHGVRLTQASTP